jgi:deoxyribodipyrimidine photo-lyase
MADNRELFDGRKLTYHPYVEPEEGHGNGLLMALAKDAAVVITDDYPTFFLPRMIAAASRSLPVRLEAVDSNGVIPMAAPGRAFPTAHGFRRWLHRHLPEHLQSIPLEDPLADTMPKPTGLPPGVAERWPAASDELLTDAPSALSNLPIDHVVSPSGIRGGSRAAAARLDQFLNERLAAYDVARNRPDDEGASGLSPDLHFGHVSAHEVVLRLLTGAGWSPDDIHGPADGRRAGWWGLPASTEAFLDQVITWRELGYGFCHHREDHDRFESLPDWAQTTLARHAGDPREYLYTLEDFDLARTHDPLWNAAQTQLVREGRMHNYLRMLWGKKILEWTESPREALRIMIELNNRYALDGRDPNSYSGIFWVLGRHDRAWGPERPVFGTVRYMSSASTARKLPVKRYLERYRPEK